MEENSNNLEVITYTDISMNIDSCNRPNIAQEKTPDVYIVKPNPVNPKLAFLYVGDKKEQVIPTLYGRLSDDRDIIKNSRVTQKIIGLCLSGNKREYIEDMGVRLMNIIEDAYVLKESSAEEFREEVLKFIEDMPVDIFHAHTRDMWKTISTEKIMNNIITINIHWDFINKRDNIHKQLKNKRCILGCFRTVATIADPLYSVIEFILKYHEVKGGENGQKVLVNFWDYIKVGLDKYVTGMLKDI